MKRFFVAVFILSLCVGPVFPQQQTKQLIGRRLSYEIVHIGSGQFAFSIADIIDTNRKIDFEISRLFDTVYDINIWQGNSIAKIATVELYSGAFYQIISRRIRHEHSRGANFEWYQYADRLSSIVAAFIINTHS